MSIKLSFTNEAKEQVGESIFKPLFARFSEILATKIKKIIAEKNGKISLIIVNDKKIQKINKEFRGFDKPTDVISFEYMEDSSAVHGGDELSVGDIFISLDTAKRQAKERDHSFQKELGILFVHGLLHVFGFDHDDDKEEAEMEKWAKKILG
ncbi:MAG: rRNA maturation RNase YbeY [Candidatus Peregrinibacteria bacterium]|nr:rRNA maturation RNase YbeY [Candidatus Peregrinibacteria bacterium]